MNHFNTKGFLERTPRGRKATPFAYEHFNNTNERGSKLNIEEFDYHLPESLIAQTPLKIETKVVCLCFKERLVK